MVVHYIALYSVQRALRDSNRPSYQRMAVLSADRPGYFRGVYILTEAHKRRAYRDGQP